MVRETVDPEGRRVLLSASAWQHIVEEHGELETRQGSVFAAVHRPDRRTAGRTPTEEWYYLATARPTLWIKVVVHFEHGEGRIVTAFPRRRYP